MTSPGPGFVAAIWVLAPGKTAWAAPCKEGLQTRRQTSTQTVRPQDTQRVQDSHLAAGLLARTGQEM